MINAVLLCGGLSTRFRSNKLMRKIDGLEIATRSFKAFEENDNIDKIVVVKKKGESEIEKLFSSSKKVIFADGGTSRFMSALYGLRALPKNTDIAILHDGARPYVTKKVIDDTITSCKKYGSGVAAIKVTDTLRKVENNILREVVERDDVVRIQTPQAFAYSKILPAYERAFKVFGDEAPFTDDSAVFSEYIGDVYVTDGENDNVKITYPEDIPDFSRAGIGYDIHKLVQNRQLILCGVKIPFEKGLLAHSDGDVPVHALMDAILSSMGKEDIGHYFPDTDEQYNGISSISLLDKVMKVVDEEDCVILNVSIAIIAEKPILSPYLDQMKANLSKSLRIPLNMIGISVTTNEKTGLIGNGEAIASYATVQIK